MDFNTLIIGAGAAGLICAAQAPGKCLVIDHAKAAGEKIRISGGGRCNFTNLYASAENYISRNPHFAKSALARYTQWDFIDWVTRSGIAYHEKTLGQLFCDTSAKEIIAMLLKGVADAGGQVQLNTAVQSVSPIDGGYAIQMSGPHGPGSVTARHLVVACGGKPIPKMGATDFALRLAQQFGIPVTHTYAGLVPFTFSGAQQEAFQAISGVAAPARLQTNGTTFEEAVLFTHRGLSGPAALQVSSYWAPGDALTLGLLSEMALRQAVRNAKETEGRKSPLTVLSRLLPARLVSLVLQDLALPERIADLTAAQLDRLAERLTKWQLTPAGTEGYRTAEVMVGGVDTSALSSKTMMAKTQPGLYFIGECVDVTGWLGGYNFQWAWSSGWVAGQAIKAQL
ncbi:NAD(P)/FAD-dependent oxidoreductase [Planktomarina sp.]|uniref:NAD(P)/FAD-dependent oxidoreductase n=1 Tax=Planktomarina sp. TaxID=2024851 RepID=UPI003C63F22A